MPFHAVLLVGMLLRTVPAAVARLLLLLAALLGAHHSENMFQQEHIRVILFMPALSLQTPKLRMHSPASICCSLRAATLAACVPTSRVWALPVWSRELGCKSDLHKPACLLVCLLASQPASPKPVW